MSETRARRIVSERSGGVCELKLPGICQGRATNYQHRKRKSHCSRAERWSPANALHVCGSGTTGCHGYIHANPAEAHYEGWEVKSWDTPETVPVRLWFGYVLLDDAGDWGSCSQERPERHHVEGCPWWHGGICDCGGIQ